MDPRAASDLTFLALVLWREARAEPREGKVAVAYSILNRVERPSWWGRSLLEVITRKWQYSSMTDPNDVQLTRWPTAYDPTWLSCLEVAASVLARTEPNPAPGADSYYAVSMPAPPRWATPETFVVQVGHHRFYNLDHDVEAPAGASPVKEHA
jgi:spore germination cell wall hydrolase CwlJ-like protein